MTPSWRSPTLAIAFSLSVGAVTATAQTVIVRDAPAGAAVEAQLNSGAAATATADAAGDAALHVPLPANIQETTVRVYVDRCGALVRVLLVETGVQPPAAAGACNRVDTGGILVTRPVTTFVVDLAGGGAVVHLRQGPAPPEWLARGAAAAKGSTVFQSTPNGLVLFGAEGIGSFSDIEQVACGSSTTCTAGALRSSVSAGAAYWFTKFAGVQAAVAKPSQAIANGSGSTFTFASGLDTTVFTVAGIGGVPVGGVRIYGMAGRSYHRSLFQTKETIDTGTQTLKLSTDGWNWVFGGGVELWATPSFAFYGEVNQTPLKGAPLGGGEGAITDSLTSIVFGVRVHPGR